MSTKKLQIIGGLIETDDTLTQTGKPADAKVTGDAISQLQIGLDTHTIDSTIHITSTERTNWNSAKTHADTSHAPSDAERNIIVGIQKNGTDVTVGSNRKINIAVPTQASDIGAAASKHEHSASEITSGTLPIVRGGTDATSASGARTNLGVYSTEEVDTKVTNAVKGLASTSSVTTSISTHNGSNTAHSDIREALAAVKEDVDTFFKDADLTASAKDTLKEIQDYITSDVSAAAEMTASIAGKSDKGHGHSISDVTGLQSALDGKAASSHGTHVSYSTAAPVVDGTASAGSASTVARSDHKHPTDTSRASKTEFDAHDIDTTKHITSTERTNWNAAKTHADSAHAPSNAEKNQNAFSNIAVGSTTVSADTVTDTVTFVGSNVTITPDATNDKITFTVADGSTSAKGLVQLTNSTSSTSTTTAATPNSVKSAYDLANTAKTNAGTAQERADAAYTLASGKVASLSDLGITATSAEINYVDGVTSNVQTQLDTLNNTVKTKANSSDLTSHTGNKSNPHGVTASQIGLGNVNNTSDANKPVSTAQATAIADAKKAGTDAQTNLDTHTANKSNPHGVTLSQLGVTATAAELNYVDGVTSNIQNQLDDKISKTSNTLLGDSVSTTWTKYGGRKVTVTGNDITFDLSSAEGGWACNFASVKDPKDVSTTMLGVYGGDSGLTHVFMGGSYSDPAMKMTPDGQFTFKNTPKVGTTDVALSGHTHSYAGSSSAGGSAASAVKLDTASAGSATQPVYFSGGKPVATTYTLGASVPSDAKFTDTDTKVTSVGNHYTPSADSSAALSVDASSSTAATWNSTSLVTGVNLQRDAKGHVTGVTVDSIKMPANPNTDTHYTTGITAGASGTTTNAAATNPYVKIKDDSTHRSQIQLKGSGATTVTSDANGVITISSTDNNTVYTHPSYTAKGSGLYKVTVDSTGHVSAATAVAKSDITALGIPAQDTVYTLPSAGTSLGGVKSGGDVTISDGVITVNDDSHNHTIANIDNLATTLNGKQDTITGAATTITGSNLLTSRALISNSSGKVAVSAVTSTELGYLDGVTSSIQTQLDGKAPSYSYGATDLTAGTSTLTTGKLHFVYE